MNIRRALSRAVTVVVAALYPSCAGDDDGLPPVGALCGSPTTCDAASAEDARSGGDAVGEATGGDGGTTHGDGSADAMADAATDHAVDVGDATGDAVGDAAGAADASDAARADAGRADAATDASAGDGAMDAPGDSGSTDATADSPPDAAVDALEAECSAYCSCMESCASVPGYPFTGAPACRAACVGFGATSRACWLAFCIESLMPGAPRAHLCEHAWGAYGEAECP